MSAGFLLIFMGIQLHVVESFTMTRRVSNFLSDNFSGNPDQLASAAPVGMPNFDANAQNYNSPYYQASYANNARQLQPAAVFQPRNRVINPPRWICWPVLFMGAVLILQGLLLNVGADSQCWFGF
jgi:hypothetical protein